MLKAKVDGKWFECGAFYSEDHPHIARKNDAVWLYGDGSIVSGFVDVVDVQKFSYQPEEESDQ